MEIGKHLFAYVLELAGYDSSEPTEENVRECFLDYVDAGYWRDLTQEEQEPHVISIEEICRAFFRFKNVRVPAIGGAAV